MKSCECGCGELIQEQNRNGPLHYKFGHSRKGLWWYEGKAHTTLGKKRPDAAARMRLHNPNKRQEISNRGMHYRIKQRLPKPNVCQNCGERPAYDLANISGKYLEDLSDWEWQCRQCHMRIDGRMNNLFRGKVMILNGAKT